MNDPPKPVTIEDIRQKCRNDDPIKTWIDFGLGFKPIQLPGEYLCDEENGQQRRFLHAVAIAHAMKVVTIHDIGGIRVVCLETRNPEEKRTLYGFVRMADGGKYVDLPQGSSLDAAIVNGGVCFLDADIPF